MFGVATATWRLDACRWLNMSTGNTNLTWFHEAKFSSKDIHEEQLLWFTCGWCKCNDAPGKN